MSDSAPVVSVILPAYNAANYLGAAIDSILAQTFTDFELLVIDDGSTDDTYQIMLGYADPRLKVLRNQSNLGLVISLNRCIAESRGYLIARMDADDISLPHRFRSQITLFEQDPHLGVVSSHYIRFTDGGTNDQIVTLPATDEEIRRNIYCKANCFCHPSSMIRKSCFEQVGLYKPEWFPAEDRELWLRIMSVHRGANVPEPLLRYRQTTQSISRRNSRLQDELNIESSAQALQHPSININVSQDKQRESVVRGLMFVAFGRASQGRDTEVSTSLRRAVALDQQTSNESFEELLIDRIEAFMYHNDYNVNGALSLLSTVFTSLPEQLSSSRGLARRLRSHVYAIAASHFHHMGQDDRAKRNAIKSIVGSRQQWRNRGLIKIAIGVSHGEN